jgi:hypothetical protein
MRAFQVLQKGNKGASKRRGRSLNRVATKIGVKISTQLFCTESENRPLTQPEMKFGFNTTRNILDNYRPGTEQHCVNSLRNLWLLLLLLLLLLQTNEGKSQHDLTRAGCNLSHNAAFVTRGRGFRAKINTSKQV